MPRLLFDFYCTPCGATFEEFVSTDIHVARCPDCGADAKRQISTPRLDPKMGLDATGFPTMGDKWARIRRQRAQIERSRDQ